MTIRSINSRRRLVSLSRIDSRGSILIIALWALTLLAVFAVILGYNVRQKMFLVKRLEARDELRYIAEAGVRKAIAELKKESEKSYHAMNDTWSSNPQAFKDVGAGDGVFNMCAGYMRDPATGARITRYGLIDEERKININQANRETLGHLFVAVLNIDEMEAQALAASIIDWRDSDEELSVPVGSAESSYYRGLPNPYEAKNADFEVMNELLLVNGMNEDIYEKVRGYITVYGQGKVNANTASREVLLALGLNEHIVKNIIAFRRGKDGIEGTADDGIFASPSSITPALSQFANLSASDVAKLTAVSEQYLLTASSCFTVNSVATMKNKKDSATTKAVVDKMGKVLYWQEG